jgi:hypothetical protein
MGAAVQGSEAIDQINVVFTITRNVGKGEKMSIFREIKMAASRLCLENLQTYETSDLPEVDQVTFTSLTFTP